MAELPKILLLGVKQSGKTSIQRVVLHGMAPHETTFLEATVAITKQSAKNDFLEFNVWDVPGQEDLTQDYGADLEVILRNCGAIIFVLDCRQSLNNNSQREFHDAVKRLIESIARVQRVKPSLPFEVFMHKIDALNEGQQSDLCRRVKVQVQEGVAARSDKRDSIVVNYHLTSIFDSSVFEAFSHVVQRLIVQRLHVTSLLELLNNQCQLQRSFLFDVQTRLCLACTGGYGPTDDSPIYELCSDFVEMVKSLQSLYAGGQSRPTTRDPLFDDCMKSDVHLSGGDVLRMRRLSNSLVFVAVAKAPLPGAATLIDFNIDVLRDAVAAMFHLEVD